MIARRGTDILEVLAQTNQEPNVVAVDEAFMIPNVATLKCLCGCTATASRNGISIVASTLGQRMCLWVGVREVETCLILTPFFGF